MLITNFAAGELSKTLFGRTDLHQYYQGAAKMENFDVIPTGGIRRRSGTKRLAELTKGDGRIIPFVVNRDLGFLLYLTPLEITVYKLVKGQVPEDGVQEPVACNYSLDDIGDVQYAQSYDTMIMCHEKYQPLEVKLASGKLNIKQLVISFKKTIEAKEGTTADDFTGKEGDETYGNGWLTQEGHYPAAVCFYNGRLVFAATKNEHQRLFVSAIKKAGEDWNFATKKVFLEPKREYMCMQVSIADNDMVTASELEMAYNFKKPVNEYFVDSIYFSPGTRIDTIKGNEITFSADFRGLYFDDERIRGELKEKTDVFDEATKKDSSLGISLYTHRQYLGKFNYTANFYGTPSASASQRDHQYEYYICYGVESITENKITKNIMNIYFSSRHRSRFNLGQWSVWEIDHEEKTRLDNGTERLTDGEIKAKIRQILIDKEVELKRNYTEGAGWANGTQYHFPDGSVAGHYSNIERSYTFNGNTIETITDYMFAVVDARRYRLHTDDDVFERWYYGDPYDYAADIIPFIGNTQKIYMAFYTREIIADEYPTPDCGFTFEIASDTNDAIRWLAVNKGLIVGTETGEWIIPPDVHATNIQAKLNSRYGSDRIQGAAVGDATCFFQTGKKSLVEYYIPQQDNNFRANNMAMLSPEMLGESPAVEFDYVNSPHTKLLITREDGAMATLLYERGTGTFAWARLTTAGKIKSAAVLPGPDGNDDAYLLVQRGGGFFLEKLQEDGGVYLDSWTKADEATWDEARAACEGDGVKACRIYRDAKGALKYEALGADAAPDWTKEGDFYIGYAYKSAMRTMPVLANAEMKKQNIVDLIIRFLGSYMPKVTAVAGGDAIQTDVITGVDVPRTGIEKVPFPGTWDEEVQAELTADEPAPVTMLALNAVMAQGVR